MCEDKNIYINNISVSSNIYHLFGEKNGQKSYLPVTWKYITINLANYSYANVFQKTPIPVF